MLNGKELLLIAVHLLTAVSILEGNTGMSLSN